MKRTVHPLRSQNYLILLTRTGKTCKADKQTWAEEQQSAQAWQEAPDSLQTQPRHHPAPVAPTHAHGASMQGVTGCHSDCGQLYCSLVASVQGTGIARVLKYAFNHDVVGISRLEVYVGFSLLCLWGF